MTRVSAATRAALGLAVVVCVLGCLVPSASASPCVDEEDCATYEVCSNSTCVTDCAAANSCGACLSRPGCTFCENAGVWQVWIFFGLLSLSSPLSLVLSDISR